MLFKFKATKAGLSLVLLTAAAFACSEQKSQAPLSVTVMSCNYSESKQCFEYFTPSAMESGQSACTETSGSWNKRQGCAAAGRVKGCKGTVNNAKAYVFWSYDVTDGADIVQAFCDRGGMYSIAGATMSVVDP
jgi:hypothetical protein